MENITEEKQYILFDNGKEGIDKLPLEVISEEKSEANSRLFQRMAAYYMMLNRIKGDRTWAQVAEDSGVSEAAISRLRNPDGKYKLTEKMAEKLAGGSDSGVTAAQLFNASRGNVLSVCETEGYITGVSVAADGVYKRKGSFFRALGVENILFKGAVAEWLNQKYNYRVSLCNPAEASIKAIDFDERATYGSLELLFRYIYIEPTDEKRGDHMMSSDKKIKVTAAEMAYNVSFCKGIVEPLVFSEPDKNRRVFVVTNSEELYKKICEKGCKSYYGYISALYLSREDGIISQEKDLAAIMTEKVDL